MINVQFQHSITSDTVNGILLANFKRENFAKLASDKLGDISGYRFYVDSEQMDLESETAFDQKKSLIKNGSIILVVARLQGGASLQVNILLKNLLNRVPAELNRITTTEDECVTCNERKPCVKICHMILCVGCFSQEFERNHLQLKCYTCNSIVPYDQIFAPGQLVNNLKSLERLKVFVKKIDCQVCTCGILAINETMYPKQTCPQCKRVYCFFCNKDWNGNTMMNVYRYSCLDNCFYETLITYKLMPFHYRTAFQIPNRRCCPTCLTLGAYDNKCKYHTCSTCRTTFCFICLEPKKSCAEKYKKSYSEKCTECKQQTYAIFPRLNKTST